ncbi:hypothetical protein SAMN05192534_10587 [Alteribacillus persepolensis]|uniref:Uncharacterized protein n=1 Tax=Alteribacillus persepolensis TaxID=568899 RepID=A0A1G8C7V6_9BACI|nr:hypothetical protein [Alteribacillus persepolensis]SDH41379.1 hypothetical protein SAMN05192534_10587 [Alteribacillus persepolensis]
MNQRFEQRSFLALSPIQKWVKRLSSSFHTTNPHDANSRIERRKQLQESKVDNRLYRASLIAFAVVVFILTCMPFVYFLPWEQVAEWFVFCLLGALFISFSLSAVTIKKQSEYVKLPYMWAILIFSILLLAFFLFILIYLRLLL